MKPNPRNRKICVQITAFITFLVLAVSVSLFLGCQRKKSVADNPVATKIVATRVVDATVEEAVESVW